MKKILKEMIQQSSRQSISYSEYMNAVLYHSKKGYYMTEKIKIGSEGDFVTSSNVANVFAKLFAKLWISMIEKEKIPQNICEIGGGNGRFANAVLQEWKEISPETYEDLTYTIIETSPYHRKLQENTILDFHKVTQVPNISQMSKFEGILFANELFDAFPVDMIELKDNCLFEVRISINSEGELEDVFVPLKNKEILTYLEEQQITLVNGQRLEIPLAMKQYIFDLSEVIEKGILFTVDYGYTNEEWMDPIHSVGSLRGFYRHQLISNPLLHPGDMDLTTHIHFDALVFYGEKAGFKYINKWRQDQFLLAAGILTYLQENIDPNPFSEKSKQNRAIRSLIMDCGMSSSFHVVVQEKNIAANLDEYLTYEKYLES